MLKNYALGSEVAEKGGFHIANISMALKDFGLVEGIDYLKFGGMTLLNKNSLKLPKYIKKVLSDSKGITDLSPYLPYEWFEEKLEGQLRFIKDKFKIIKISNKKFVVILDEVLKRIMFDERKVKVVVDIHEIPELTNKNLVDGYLKISNKKALCWY